jgi:hypothetical protein
VSLLLCRLGEKPSPCWKSRKKFVAFRISFGGGQTLLCHRLKSASGAFTNQTNGSYINIKATTRRPLDIHISFIALKIARRFRTIRATGTKLK